MRNLLVILGVMLLLGTGFGVAISGFSTKPMARPGQQAEAERVVASVRRAEKAKKDSEPSFQLPKAICQNPVFNFGLMDPLNVGEHVFEIENKGAAPLEISGGGSSCKCTLSDLESAVIAPGDSFAVKLTWNSGHASRQFQQSAIVRTNDPISPEIELAVVGQVKAVLTALPSTANFDRLVPSNAKEIQVAIYSQTWETFDIERVETNSQYIKAEVEPRSKFTQSFAYYDEVRNALGVVPIKLTYSGNAPSGPLSALLRVYVRPPDTWKNGIPVDSLNDAQSPLKIRAEHDGENTVRYEQSDLPDISYPTLPDGTVLAEIGIVGEVVRRLGLYGPTVKGEGLIELGKITSRESLGKNWTIVLRIRGDESPERVEAEIEGIPNLSVEVENTSTDKATNSYRLTLKLDQQLEPGIYDRETAGRLTIRTPGLPGNEQLQLPINLDVLE